MKTISRVWHDNLVHSKQNYRLENRLRQEIMMFINHALLPALRTRNQSYINRTKTRFLNEIIEPYSNTSYRLGSNYVATIVNKQNIFTEDEIKSKQELRSQFHDEFWKKIDGLVSIERTENKQGFQYVALEKDRIASELSSLIAWRSFNKGIMNKGNEFKNDLKEMAKSKDKQGLTYITRSIRSKDLKDTTKQKIITGRSDKNENKEYTSQVKQIELDEVPAIPDWEKLTGPAFFVVYVFVTMKDEKVCEYCRSLETEQWFLEDPDVPDPPVHPNCRCRLAYAEILE